MHQEIISEVDDVSQGVQDQSVGVSVELRFIMVVLHREDAVQRNSDVCAEPLNLHLKITSSSDMTAHNN